MLVKMEWQKGQGLGKDNMGVAEPVGTGKDNTGVAEPVGTGQDNTGVAEPVGTGHAGITRVLLSW